VEKPPRYSDLPSKRKAVYFSGKVKINCLLLIFSELAGNKKAPDATSARGPKKKQIKNPRAIPTYHLRFQIWRGTA